MSYQRAQLGDEIPIAFQCVDASGVPVEPDAAPTLKVYDESSTKVYDATIPPKDRQRATGLFGHFVRLGSSFTDGQLYSWRATWASGVFNGVRDGRFHVNAGGDADGAVIAMTYVEFPGADRIIYQTDAGLVKQGKNPR